MPGYDVTLVAHFTHSEQDIFQVTVDIEPDDAGHVTGMGSFPEGDQVTLLATPNDNFVFNYWEIPNRDITNENPLNFSMPAHDLHITGHFREAVNATISPDEFVFADFEDFQPVQTTITWNDASMVTGVYIMMPDQMPFPFFVEPVDEYTATLTIGDWEKMVRDLRLKEGGLTIEGRVYFDVGEPASFSVRFTDPNWWIDIVVFDIETEMGIYNAEIIIHDTDLILYTDEWGYVGFTLPEGEYLATLSAEGYITVVDFPFEVRPSLEDDDENFYSIAMTPHPGLFNVFVSVDPPGSGTATGGGEYAQGESVTLSATSEAGFRFEKWTGSEGQDISTDSIFTIQMPGHDVSVTAHFTLLTDVYLADSEQYSPFIFPNPSRGHFQIEAQEIINLINIYDLAGKQVFSQMIHDKAATLITTLDAGLYIVAIYVENTVYRTKIQIR